MNKNRLLLLPFLIIYILLIPVFATSENICAKDSDCLNFGQCQLLPDSITGKLKKQCKCTTDFVGTNCEFQKCPENPCENTGICELTNSANKFKCHCPLGYSGSLCERKISNACDTKVCKNGHCRLNGTIENAICDCFYGFEGEKCDTKTLCDPVSCSGHGICSTSSNGTSINCLCDSGWSGERCERDINECENDATLCNNGECVNSPGSYFCRCSTGFIGVHCDKKYSSGGCLGHPCQNGGTCLTKSSKNGRDFTCKCPAGFTGDLCEENIDDCARYDNPNLGDAGKNLSKCTNGGSCIDGINEFHCVCPNGFTGNDCRQNIDECNIFGSNLCQNGGSCIDTYGTYQCACVYGFEGKNCEINVNDCENNLCYQGSKCIDKIRSYECECQEDRIGIYCQFKNPCLNKNKCQNGQCFADITNGNFSCFCDKGFTGEYCNTDINECETQSPCYKGKCINEYGGYKCECEKGYDGPNCDILIDECEGRPCLNGGTCIDLAGDFKCICMPSWNGKHCEIPKPYSPACDKLMCMHGGVCRKTPFGEEFCQCSARFSGKSCELIKPDPCESNNCSENSIKCHPTNNYNFYTCECKNGYGGEFCEQKIQNCKDNPCLVGECLDTSHGFQCQCPLGYKGINCEININECKQNICRNGICVDEINGYSCKCPATHIGKHCEIPVTNPCQNEPCLNNGTCMTYNIHGSFICKCPKGFTGNNCETRTDICDTTKCQNGGFCNPGEQQCQCPEGFNGTFCEKNQNKCLKVVCQNGGTCENLDNDFVCKCPYIWPFGYAGRYCQEKVNIEKYKPEELKEKEECQRNKCEKLAGNGKCDKECNYPGCNYDGGDCSASIPDPFENCTYASFCKYVFRDDHCDEICNNEGCLFDGFDCQEKTPTKCPSEDYCLKEYGNGFCNPECNSAACGWDGGDCVEMKEELPETLVLTLITDPDNFIKNTASKLLVTLSQLLHSSVHYQLDTNGNPMIYEWSSINGQGSLIQVKSDDSYHLITKRSVGSHSIKKRSVDNEKKGVKVYLILDVSVCQQLSSLSSSLHTDVQIENQKCFTNSQSAADMLAADSRKDVLSDLNITVADARVMQKPSSESSSIIGYVIFGVLAFIAVIMFSLNVLQRHVKKVIVRTIFFPPTSEELSKRQNMHQKRPYGNQFDRQSLIGDAAANTVYIPGLDNSVSSIEPAAKRFREEQPIPSAIPIQHDRIFTELHQHAASAEPISDEHIPRLIPCAKVVDSDGRSCIHWAIECVSDKLDSQVIGDIKKLVSIGCPIDAQDDSGATALHLAVRNGRTEVATYLLGHINVNIQDDNGRTALFDAVSTKSVEMVQKILKVENVDVNAVAHTNDTALIKCCRIDDENDMVSIAEALLKHPSIQIDKTGDKASADYNGRMAIHEAAACNSIQILKLLISRGAAVSAHDVHQQTPLFLAVQSNQTEAVKLLINQMRANKAEINSSNDCDETPLQIAISKGFTEIAELLRNAGAQMSMPCMPIYPPVEHPKYPKMKAITGPAVNRSPQFPIIERLSSNNNSVRKAKRKKAVPQASTSSAQQQQQNMQNLQANAIAQQQMMMGLYPSNDPTFQMQAYAGMHQQMLPYPYPPPQMSLSNYPQTSQPQILPQQQQQYQQLQPNQTQRPSTLQQQNPPSNFSSNPPSAHLPQSLSVSPHVSDSAYGSPNSYQNSTTNTSGHSDTSSNFPSPPSSHDLWHNPSPDTVTGSTSTIVAPIQPSYAQTASQIKQDYSGYVDNRYGCHSSQYPQQQTLDYQTQMYNSSTNLQYYPNSMMYPPSQHPYYHDPYQRQREPRIEYPQPTMHRSASFAAFDSH